MMKRRMTLTLMLTTSLLLSLVSFTAAQGPQRLKPVDDTGVITLGTNDMLRLTVAVGDVNGDGCAVQFRQAAYVQGGVNNGVYKLMLTSQSTSPRITLMPGEAASIDIDSYSWGVRAMVFSDNPNVKVNAMIIDKTTGNIIGVLMGDSGPAR
jgi:hypothetical protein